MKGMVVVKLYKTKEPEIYYYFNANGEKLWMFRHKYYDKTGKRREKKKSSYKTEKAALRALLEVKAATLSGESKQVEHDQLTVGEWLDIWYDTHKNDWKVTSRKQREMAIRLQMKPLLGKYKLQQLDRSTYKREYLNVLEKKYKPSTVQLLHNLFKIAINAAVDDEILLRNRFTKMTLSVNQEAESQPENYFSPAELNKFLQSAKEHENETNYTFFLTLAFTGVRRGEALGLQWKNIDTENKTITIERTRDGKGVRTPKTKNSYRTIPVADPLIRQLQAYRKWCLETKLYYGLKMKEDSFVFISYQNGEPIGDNTPMYSLRRLLEKANIGVKPKDKLPTVTLHGLRHTHCTMLLSQGANVKAIAERLGNTPQMIYEIYGHVLEEMEMETVALFSRSLEATGAKSGANL